MAKRILAWVLLAGFVLLLLNISIFHIYTVPSFGIYVVIAIGFVFSKGRLRGGSKINTQGTSDHAGEKNEDLGE
jgi:hypothetical protein